MTKSKKKDELNQLLGDVGHEYNNLLTAILANLRLAGQETLPYRARKNLDKAVENTVRAADLTHYLLTLSQNQNPRFRIVEPNELARGLEPKLKKHLGRFRKFRFIPSLIRHKVYVDPIEFEKALMTLCINSCESMPEGGEVTVKISGYTLDGSNPAEETFENGHYVLIEISDDGPGVHREAMTQALAPISKSTEQSNVIGLGLSQVLDFVEKAQGYIRVAGKQQKGTTIKILLPRYTGISEEHEPGDSAKKAPGLKGNGEVVLLVEDDMNVLSVVGQGLKARNYDLILAEDGEKAMNVINREDKIDLLVTDVFLIDEVGGKEVAEAFHKKFPTSGVIFCSGYHENVVRKKLKLAKDEDAIVPKPYELTTLLRKMAKVLEKQSRKT